MEKPLGKEGKLKIRVENGKVILSAELDSAGVDAKLEVALEGDYFIDKVTEAIPGQIDNAIGEMLKGAIKNVKV